MFQVMQRLARPGPVSAMLNQNDHYTRCSTPKRVMSWRGPFPRHCAPGPLFTKKCHDGGELFATLCPI